MRAGIATAAEIDRATLDAFLARMFPERKARFLRNHGDWWHRGAENRWGLLQDGAVIGYCAVMPAQVRIGGAVVEAAWWVDLVLDPAHRSQGLQRLFDEKIRQRPVTLGFPNALAAAIHRKHGWGVRENFSTRVAPLAPRAMPALRRRPGPIRVPLGLVLEALAWLRRAGRSGSRAVDAVRWEETDIPALAELDGRLPASWVTARRSPEYLRWRYGENPQRGQLRLLRSDRAALILRIVEDQEPPTARILDLFGILEESSVAPLVVEALRSAREAGACQLSALSANPQVDRLLARSGFFLSSTARFCWDTRDETFASQLSAGPYHWTLGDADHDDP